MSSSCTVLLHGRPLLLMCSVLNLVGQHMVPTHISLSVALRTVLLQSYVPFSAAVCSLSWLCNVLRLVQVGSSCSGPCLLGHSLLTLHHCAGIHSTEGAGTPHTLHGGLLALEPSTLQVSPLLWRTSVCSLDCSDAKPCDAGTQHTQLSCVGPGCNAMVLLLSHQCKPCF